jgi:hypothetical protein
MLDAWIINDIKRKEQEREEQNYLPLQLPVPMPYWREPDPEVSPPPAERGVVIIEF